jgi:hypothetical protein
MTGSMARSSGDSKWKLSQIKRFGLSSALFPALVAGARSQGPGFSPTRRWPWVSFLSA